MKEDLSRKEITRCIGNGFEVYIEYRVDWVAKYGKMGEKYPFLAFFGDMYRYTLNLYRYTLNLYRYMLGSGRFCPTCTGTGQTCTGTPCSVSTSFRILAITCSFLIRFK